MLIYNSSQMPVSVGISPPSAFFSFFCKVMRLLSVFFDTDGSFSDSSGTPESSDRDLALKARENPDSFAQLFEKYLTPVYRYFFFRLRHREDSEDLTSLTFEKAFLGLKNFRDDSTSFPAWLFKIANNCLIDHYRRIKPVDSLDELSETGFEPSENFDLQGLNRKMLITEVWEEIRTLPEKYQTLWALKLASDLPHQEIAKILNISENNVNVMIHRSLGMLRKKILNRHK